MKLVLEFDPPLDYFLAGPKHPGPLAYALERKTSVKDIIECLGVPHTEVGHLAFDGKEIDFSFIPSSPGRVTVDAITPPFNVLIPTLLRPVPLKRLKFIADVNVIKLGRLLIIMGFDVRYSSSLSDREIADISQQEGRIVLTRDTELLKRRKIIFARRIKADFPYDQLVETLSFFGLERQLSFFSRCTRCNCRLVRVAKEQIIHLLEPRTKIFFTTFFQCPRCKGVFWKGSHFDNMQKKMASMGISTND